MDRRTGGTKSIVAVLGRCSLVEVRKQTSDASVQQWGNEIRAITAMLQFCCKCYYNRPFARENKL